VFIDVDPETYTLDPSKLAPAITSRTKAIIPIHLYGHCADMGPILQIAAKHGLKIVEDCAQAHGAECEGRRAGAMGDFGCFSFFPGKNLGAFGDGGMVTTRHENEARRLRMLANHGRETKHDHLFIGYNYRMDALQAAILRVKLPHLERWIETRRRLARRYSELLAGLPLQTPIEKWRHVYQHYVIQCDDRDGLAGALKAEGVATGIHYPIPLHLQPCLRHLPSAGPGRLPVTEALAGRILSLPIYPEMTEAQQDRIVLAIRKFFA
jgi:dTDP-4-amino-4,6-dideoxygalactose transaminase